MPWIVGVDVGGTFTDIFAVEPESGRSFVHKVPSRPDDPARAVIDGVAALAERTGLGSRDLVDFRHGTTVGTNALIERRGAEVALVTTDGFRDLLEIGRQTRPLLYDLQADRPAPLVPRKRRFEAAERLDAEGGVLVPLDAAEVERTVAAVRASGAGACAVCLLFAFRNDVHERALAAALATALPDLPLSLSSDVMPEFREFERFSTTVLNAYLQPVVAPYMETLGAALAAAAPAARVGINQSNGGLMAPSTAARYPVRTVLSGPAAGAVGAAAVARSAGRGDAVTLDMGGTSADVCLLRGGEAGISFSREVAGFPVRLPMVDINTVGAGGGSIAWFDRDGLMKVGPQSAGADPGPACYGRGGSQATVSDANAVLGRLPPDGLLDGAMALDLDAARAALAPCARRLDMSVERTAHGIVAIVAANMVRAIRAVSVERGLDPRGFALIAFGGAGPMHATEVARALGMREIVVPPDPGLLCAQGLLAADRREEFVRSQRLPLDRDGGAALAETVAALEREAEAWFAREAAALAGNGAERQTRLAYDMRYVGQNFELSVADERRGEVDAARLRELFLAVHEASYGFHNADDPVEIVNVRLTALLADGRPHGGRAPPAAAAAPERRRAVFFAPEGAEDTPVYRRAALGRGQTVEGPAAVDQLDATVLIHPGDRARVDGAGNLVVALAP